MNHRTTKIALAMVTSASMLAVTGPAQAKGDDDVERRGSCSGTTDWKVKVGPEDGGLEVEGEIDSNRTGQRWRWQLVHNGSRSGTHTRVTRGPSGSFEVRRVLANRRGTDVITLRASNRRSGEWCVGRVRF
jgi:hypothetical protein